MYQAPFGSMGQYEHPGIQGNTNAGGKDGIVDASSPNGIFAPQGRILAQLNVPTVPSRAESRPDFIRGFGLDIPEEEEEEAEEELEGEVEGEVEMDEQLEAQSEEALPSGPLETSNKDLSFSEAADSSTIHLPDSNLSKAGVHTRQASRVSVALSLGSTNRYQDETATEHGRKVSIEMGQYVKELDGQEIGEVADPLTEWTGSEDMKSGDEALEDEEVRS